MSVPACASAAATQKADMGSARSSRHDLTHLVAHGKNWRPVEYADGEEQRELEGRLADVANDSAFAALKI